MTQPIGEFTKEQLDEIRQARDNELEQLKRIDRLSLIDVPKEQIDRMRERSLGIIEQAEKILSVYGNG